MAMINAINIHHADVMKATVHTTDGTSWLRLSIGETWPAEVSLFMDRDLAQLYAAAINSANAQHEQILEDEAAFAAEVKNREQSYADEHRQRVHEVL